MKHSSVVLVAFQFLCGPFCTLAQGTFENLGFESATLVPIADTPPFYYFAQAFPGWAGYIGGVQAVITLSNTVYMDSAGFSIIERTFRNPTLLPGGLIEGNYTAVLMAGRYPTPTQTAEVTLAQTGTIPSTAQSLWFKAEFVTTWAGSFDATLGGQTLSLIPVQAETNYTLYAADIHSWAGQTAELGFTVFPNPDLTRFGDNYLYLDSIQFSDVVIPEPTILSLVALGALLFGARAGAYRR